MFYGIYWQPVLWFILALLVRCTYSHEKHPFSERTLHITDNVHILKRRGAEPEPSSEPLAEGTPEPESEKAPVSEGKEESDTEPEASMQNSTAEPEAEPEDWPEPGPRWQQAYQMWQWGWELHVYGFATVFLLMGIYAGYYVAFNIYDGLDQKYLSVSLNVMVLIFGLTRAFVLYFDPYHQGHMIKALVFMRIVWSIGSPCLTAADSLVILALVETSKLSLAPPRIQKPGSISVVITLHFLFVLLSDTIVSMYVEAKIMLLFCQIFFVVWGGVLGVGYFVLAYKLDKKLFGLKPVKTKEDKMYIYLIYASGVANFFICGIMVYSAADVFGVYSDRQFVDAWPWYALQTISRGGEVISCVLVFTVSAKRTRVRKAVEESEAYRPGISTNSELVNATTFKGNLTRMFFSRLKINRIEVSPVPGISQTNSYSESSAFQSTRKRFNLFICSRRGSSVSPILDNKETDEKSGDQTTHSLTVSLHGQPRQDGKNILDNRNTAELLSAKHLDNKCAANTAISEASSLGKVVSHSNYDICESEKTSSNMDSVFRNGFSRRMNRFSVLQEENQEANNISDDVDNCVTDQHLNRKRGRRMSMFSALQESKIEADSSANFDSIDFPDNAVLTDSELMSKNNHSTFKRSRGRRMSMFSALQESKMDAEFIANDFQTESFRKKNNLDDVEEF